MRHCSGRSPDSTLPPGNSHNPAMALPEGRCAIRTRPSVSIKAHAATRTSLTVTGFSSASLPKARGLKLNHHFALAYCLSMENRFSLFRIML